MMENKTGMSHIGFMLSFSIFVVFLIFAYTILWQENFFLEGKQSVIKNLEKNFIEEIKSNVVIATVFENASGYDCVSFDASDFENYSYYIVKENEQIVGAYKTENILKMEYDGTPTLFKVYFSDSSFEGNTTSNSNCISSDIKYIQKRKEIFEEKILETDDYYKSAYDYLKEDLKIPYERDFGFEFEYENGTIIKTEEKNILGEIYVEEIPIHYFDAGGNFLEGKIRLKVW